MDEHKRLLSKGFSNFIRTYNKFQLSTHNSKTIKDGNIIVAEGVSLLSLLKSHVRSLESVLSDCQDFMEEVEEDLAVESKDDDFVFSTYKGMLSYKGRDYVKKVVKKPVDKLTNKPTNKIAANPTERKIKKVIQKPTEKILIPEIGYYLNLKVVDKLSEIQPMMHYYNNPKDKKNLPGIYCTLLQDVHVKIPFPTVIDSTKEYGRVHSIRCKYVDKTLCDEQRIKMASFHDSQVRKCNFAHLNEKIIKIGYPSRCSYINFGNSRTLKNDVKMVHESDVKNLLLYGLNDVMSSIVWMEYNNVSDKIYNNVEMV